jgi:rhodanese-related sulfurtransferase
MRRYDLEAAKWALPPPTPLSDRLVEAARLRLARLNPEQAAAEMGRGALLIDMRTSEQRKLDGEIPGAREIERNVLEWRLDPTSPWRIDDATDVTIRVILICAEGYSSSLAAASLQEMGLVNATDVIGGFAAWRAAHLPVRLEA